MNPKHSIIIILPLLLGVLSCKKLIEVPSPEDQILSEQVFISNSKAQSAVTAIYGNMINGSPSFANFLTTIYGGMSSDELARYNPSAAFQEFISNELTATNSQVKNIWSSAYKTIYYANVALEGLERSAGVDQPTKNQLQGECRFLRAFCYFYLVNLFGDVPLVTTSDYAANSVVARAPVANVYDLIEADLMEARSKLGATYPDNEKSRPNKWAATALLARVYLYRGDWTKADQFTTEVINSGAFTPLPSLTAVFLKNSKEAIWQLAPTNGSLQEIRQIRPSGSSPQAYLYASYVAGFEQGDQRRTRWIDSVTVQSVRYHYPAKYRNTSTAVTEYYMVLRVAEQYLIRAEALARMNKVNEAIADLNVVRTRAGLPGLSTSLDQGGVLLAIERERKAELFAEWAHRWLDLKRTGKAQILSNLKANWNATDVLYPIPQDELLANPNLTQNPGY